MKSIKITFSTLVILLQLVAVNSTVKSQMLDTATAFRINIAQSNEKFPSWSKDGNRLVFQSTFKSHSEILLYDFNSDSLITITRGDGYKTHPVFIPKGHAIACDVRIGNQTHIFKTNLETGITKLLFKRKLFCKDPSFSPSGRVVVFIGYDKKSETWQLFSYDFVYDNLNQLTRLKNKKLYRPLFSPDGKTILFGTEDTQIPYRRSLRQISWYGGQINMLDSLEVSSYCWMLNSYRIACSVNNPRSTSSFFTVRNDGTFVLPLCNDTIMRVTPSLSPDGKKMAVAVKFNNNFDIVVYNLMDE